MTPLFSVFPKNISTYGADIDNLFWLILAVVGVAFVISVFILLRPVFTNHYKKVPKAEYITGEKKQHFRWIVIALVLLAVSDFAILFAEHPVWARTQEEVPDPDLHVAIIGRQWNWIFVYPGPDNKLNTSDDVYVDQQNSSLHVPVNKNVVIDLKARDVLHSFFVAELRLKQDAIPGRTTSRWFNATTEGTYDLVCAEICGVLHSQMRNFLVVESEENFKQFTDTLYAKTNL